MKNHLDELTKSRAQSATRRGALRKFGVGIAAMTLAALLVIPAKAYDNSLRGQPLQIPVALSPGAPADQTISATLSRPPGSGGTLQILLHGATYSHVYWDFPFKPERYSYVRAMSRAGYATLNM